MGRLQKISTLKALVGIVAGTSRKVEAIESKTVTGSESVALNIDVSRFMLTITKSFVLLTLQEGTERKPIIQKSWQRTARSIGKGLTEEFGIEDKYTDADKLVWEHKYKRQREADELVAFNASGEESLVLTLETFN